MGCEHILIYCDYVFQSNVNYKYKCTKNSRIRTKTCQSHTVKYTHEKEEVARGTSWLLVTGNIYP